jgi:hypothetical protein
MTALGTFYETIMLCAPRHFGDMILSPKSFIFFALAASPGGAYFWSLRLTALSRFISHVPRLSDFICVQMLFLS